MSFSMLLICDNCIKIDIFNTSEYVLLDVRTNLCQVFYKLLYLCSLRTFSCSSTRSTSFCETACTLYELKIIIILPVDNVASLIRYIGLISSMPSKFRAVKLWHHSLYLSTIQHTHKNSFYDIIIMMAKCYLVTAQFPLPYCTDNPFSFLRTDNMATLLYRQLYQIFLF